MKCWMEIVVVLEFSPQGSALHEFISKLYVDVDIWVVGYYFCKGTAPGYCATGYRLQPCFSYCLPNIVLLFLLIHNAGVQPHSITCLGLCCMSV